MMVWLMVVPYPFTERISRKINLRKRSTAREVLCEKWLCDVEWDCLHRTWIFHLLCRWHPVESHNDREWRLVAWPAGERFVLSPPRPAARTSVSHQFWSRTIRRVKCDETKPSWRNASPLEGNVMGMPKEPRHPKGWSKSSVASLAKTNVFRLLQLCVNYGRWWWILRKI